MRRFNLAMAVAVVFGTLCCGEAGVDPLAVDPDGPKIAINVGALDLPGITNATYTLTVTNAATDQVWQQTIDSDSFGDGAGSASYVGPCDAQSNPNTVTLTLDSLEDVNGVVAPATYVNPTPVARDVTCTANEDVEVAFNLAIIRNADQGFFDVAISFSDVFCSAKFDCGDTTAPADDINLLHNAGVRDMTAVLGFACTGGVGADTHLYLDNIVIDCGSPNGTTVVDVSGLGNVDLSAAPSSNPDGYLYGAQVSRGAEDIVSKAFWNVSLGLDEANFPAAACTLTTTGTASDGPLAGGETPADTTWPVVEWNLTLSQAGARACTDHPLNGSPAGVASVYTPVDAPASFDWFLVRGTELVDEASCDPAERTANNYCGCPAVDCTTTGGSCDATSDPDAPTCVVNYFGDGSDGDVTVNSPTQLTVPNKSGSYNGDMVVMHYDNLTVNSTLTTDQPGRGLLIYVQGDLTVNNGGVISMTARGAAADPVAEGVSADGLRFVRFDGAGADTLSGPGLIAGTGAAAVAAEDNQQGVAGNGTIFTITREGAARGTVNAQPGIDGAVGETGGGGSGGGYNVNALGGAAGTCFSGGTGGGGSGGNGGGGASQPNGGQGGTGVQGGSGGAGNPVGGGGGSGLSAGTGGLMVIIVGGDVTINAGGRVEANGSSGGNTGSGGGGGSSGGGAILLLHGGVLSNAGTIEAVGGPTTSGQLGGGTNGGAGGDGSIQIGSVLR